MNLHALQKMQQRLRLLVTVCCHLAICQTDQQWQHPQPGRLRQSGLEMTSRDGQTYLCSSCPLVPIRTESCHGACLCGVSVFVRFCCPMSRGIRVRVIADVTTKDLLKDACCVPKASAKASTSYSVLSFHPSELQFHDGCLNLHLLILHINNFPMYIGKEVACREEPSRQ